MLPLSRKHNYDKIIIITCLFFQISTSVLLITVVANRLAQIMVAGSLAVVGEDTRRALRAIVLVRI